MQNKAASVLLILTLAVALPPAAAQAPGTEMTPGAQSSFSVPLFPSPNYFKEVFRRPAQYRLEAPGSIHDLVIDGKLTLSVNDVVRLVVQRNTNVWLARLDVQGSEPAVQKAMAVFDPRFVGSFTTRRAVTPTSTELEASSSLAQQAQFRYEQQFATGTAYSFAINGSKNANNNRFVFLNPAIGSNMAISISQPLLRGRGMLVQRSPIIIAGINRQISRGRFEEQLHQTLQTAMDQYWNVVQARENLKVLQESLALAEKSYARDKRALELGALPPLDIFRSEAEVATRKVAVTTAQYQLRQQEDALRRLISADLDPAVRDLPLELVDSPEPPVMLLDVDSSGAVERALRVRPELANLRRRQTIDEINIRTAANSLKPDLRLTGNYLSSGLGGNFFEEGVQFRGGLSDALRQVFDFDSPTYGFGLFLTLPLRNREAQADLATAQIQHRKDLFEERQAQQQVTLEVRNAINELERSKANIVAATAARDLARKTQEAEQRKYELGASTIFFVLEAQQRASDAEQQLLAARIAYRKAVISVHRATGALLDENQVVLNDALAVK